MRAAIKNRQIKQKKLVNNHEKKRERGDREDEKGSERKNARKDEERK